MRSKIKYLLNDLCVDLGFCIPPKDAKRIVESKQLEADDFACQILVAEGMNPEYEIQWRRKIREKFIKQLGTKYYEG